MPPSNREILDQLVKNNDSVTELARHNTSALLEGGIPFQNLVNEYPDFISQLALLKHAEVTQLIAEFKNVAPPQPPPQPENKEKIKAKENTSKLVKGGVPQVDLVNKYPHPGALSRLSDVEIAQSIAGFKSLEKFTADPVQRTHLFKRLEPTQLATLTKLTTKGMTAADMAVGNRKNENRALQSQLIFYQDIDASLISHVKKLKPKENVQQNIQQLADIGLSIKDVLGKYPDTDPKKVLNKFKDDNQFNEMLKDLGFVPRTPELKASIEKAITKPKIQEILFQPMAPEVREAVDDVLNDLNKRGKTLEEFAEISGNEYSMQRFLSQIIYQTQLEFLFLKGLDANQKKNIEEAIHLITETDPETGLFAVNNIIKLAGYNITAPEILAKYPGIDYQAIIDKLKDEEEMDTLLKDFRVDTAFSIELQKFTSNVGAYYRHMPQKRREALDKLIAEGFTDLDISDYLKMPEENAFEAVDKMLTILSESSPENFKNQLNKLNAYRKRGLRSNQF